MFFFYDHRILSVMVKQLRYWWHCVLHQLTWWHQQQQSWTHLRSQTWMTRSVSSDDQHCSHYQSEKKITENIKLQKSKLHAQALWPWTASKVLPSWLVQIETELVRNTMLPHLLLLHTQPPPPPKKKGCGPIAGYLLTVSQVVLTVNWYPFIHLCRERHFESKVSWPTTQHNAHQTQLWSEMC